MTYTRRYGHFKHVPRYAGPYPPSSWKKTDKVQRTGKELENAQAEMPIGEKDAKC